MGSSGFTLSIENLDGFCRIICGGRFDEDMFMHIVNLMRKDLLESVSPKRYLMDLRGTHWRPEACALFPAVDFVCRELGDTRVAVLVGQGLLDGFAKATSDGTGLPVLITRVSEEALAWVAEPAGHRRGQG